MGERRNEACRVDSDPESRMEFHGVKVTSDAGLLAYRELDDVFGLTEMAGRQLCDPRTGKNPHHTATAQDGFWSAWRRSRNVARWPHSRNSPGAS